MPQLIPNFGMSGYSVGTIGSQLSQIINGTSSSTDTDWRKPQDPSDLLFALNSYYSKEDFSGRAAIYESVSALKPLNIDLVVHSADIVLDEHIQVIDHIGDSFSVFSFGKAPLNVTYTAVMPDSHKTYGKQYLVDAWKNKLRLSAVARTGKVPIMQFTTHFVTGPFTSMRITENSQSEDTLTVVLSMLVTHLKIM